MSAIHHFINRIKAAENPKAEIITVTCENCGHEFDVTTNQVDDESWRTDDETSETSGDPDDGDDDSDDDDDYEFEDMTTPQKRDAATAAIAKSILNTAKQRDFVGAKPEDIGPQRCIEIVAAKQKVENSSPADLLARALQKAAKEARK